MSKNSKAAEEVFLVKKTGADVQGSMKYGVLMIVLGIVLFGVTMPIYADFENYNNIRQPLDEAGSPLADEFTLPLYMIAPAGLLCISGGISLHGYFKNSRAAVFVSIVLAFVATAVCLYICVTVKTTLDTLFDRLQSTPMSDDSFTDNEVSILDFTGAIFNECCLSTYDSNDYNSEGFTGQLTKSNGDSVDINQRAVPECGETVAETCPFDGADIMFPEVVTTLLADLGSDNLNDLLCHCYGNEGRFNKFIEIFQRDNMCEKFRHIKIADADSREIPVIEQTFSAVVSGLGAIGFLEISEQLPIGTFALVGKILPPQSTYGEPEEDIGFSCGLGYAKALALYLYIYIEDKTDILLGGGFFVGAAAGLFSLLLPMFWYFGGNTDRDADDEGYDYEYEKPKKSVSKPERSMRPAVEELEIVPKTKKKLDDKGSDLDV